MDAEKVLKELEKIESELILAEDVEPPAFDGETSAVLFAQLGMLSGALLQANEAAMVGVRDLIAEAKTEVAEIAARRRQWELDNARRVAEHNAKIEAAKAAAAEAKSDDA